MATPTPQNKRQTRTDMELVLAYLKQEHKQFKVNTDFPEWELKDLAKTVPQQKDGRACGVFTCAYALFKIMGLPLNFEQCDNPTLHHPPGNFLCEIILTQKLFTVHVNYKPYSL